MEKNLSYESVNGSMVTIDDLEEMCSEMGYLLRGSIVNLKDISTDISDEQCARLRLSLTGLSQVVNYLDKIFPSSLA